MPVVGAVFERPLPLAPSVSRKDSLMRLLATLGRVLDAFVTAAAVVFGLKPDPTLVPVERDLPHQPYDLPRPR